MAEQFIRNKNNNLVGATIIGASYKIQNLGFTYKIVYKLSTSRLLEIEVYTETFSQKYVQVSMKELDFFSDFSSTKLGDDLVDKITKYISAQASLALVQGEYSILLMEGKSFFFGNLMRINMKVKDVEY